MTITLKLDLDADAAYLQLSENEVVETREAAPGVLVDVDSLDVAVGVEVLSLDTYIPRDVLTTEFHVREEAVRALDHIGPSLTSMFQRYQANDHQQQVDPPANFELDARHKVASRS